MEKGMDQREKAAKWYKKFQVSDYATLLHLPFSIVVLDFVIIGAMIAQNIYLDRLILTLIGIFFAHQGAHYLDEIKGHHWGTKVPNRRLYGLSASFLIVAAAIAVYLSVIVSLLLLLFIIPLVFLPVAYSLELWNGRFHTPLWFGVSCALVCIGSFFLQTLTISLFSLFMSIAIGVQGIYIIILYEATKEGTTRTLAWNALKGIVVLWSFIALAMIASKIF